VRKFFLAPVIFLAVAGCGGSGSTPATAKFAGTYSGTWVNTTNAADAGTSTWTISRDGIIDGHDFDAGRDTTFHVVGEIDGKGNITSVSTPTTGAAATLNGPVTFGADGKLSGILAWGVTPVLDYTYTFTKVAVDPPAVAK